MSRIHASAVVEDGASIADGVEIGPFAVIGPEVTIGAGSRIHSHVTIAGRTTLGPECEVFPFTTLGEPPQDIKYADEPTSLEIGARTRFREHVSIHRGTPQGGKVTRIGSDCFFMVATHIAHDCQIGNNVIFVNQATLAGHCEIGDHAIVGALSALHQFTRVGKHAFIAGMTAVQTDVIPFGIAKGNRSNLHGLNLIGLRRRGFDRDRIKAMREAYRMIFLGPTHGVQDRAASAASKFADCEPVMDIVNFIQARPDRHLCLPKQHDVDVDTERS